MPQVLRRQVTLSPNRPKFDHIKGTYYCSGYHDDADFKNCHSTFQLNELKRDPWEA